MGNHLELKLRITSDNLGDDDIRDILYEAYEYNSILSREEQLKKDRPELFEISSKIQDEGRAEDWTFAENRIRHFKENLFSAFQGETKVEKFLYLTSKIRYYPHFNEQSRAILDVIAPEFFKMYPNGEIWFVELSKATLHRIWDDEDKLRVEYNTNSLGSPHEMSGLEGGVSITRWLSLLMYCFYPFINGVLVTPDARLLFLFLPSQSINSFREYRFDPYRETVLDLMDIYNDRSNSSGRGIKTRFPRDAAVLSTTRCYFEWYIRRCNELLAELLAIQDLKQRFIATLTLNRLAVDARIIETTEIPYLTKLLFYGVLDKFANLYVQLGIESREHETEVWKTLLAMDFFENEVRDSLIDIPGHVGKIIYHRARRIFEHLEDWEPSPEIIRELRNSYHGYGLGKVDMLLNHSGELNNDVPALSNILWHWLLAKGLPKKKLTP